MNVHAYKCLKMSAFKSSTFPDLCKISDSYQEMAGETVGLYSK